MLARQWKIRLFDFPADWLRGASASSAVADSWEFAASIIDVPCSRSAIPITERPRLEYFRNHCAKLAAESWTPEAASFRNGLHTRLQRVAELSQCYDKDSTYFAPAS